jgi:hypothetical protein
MLAQEKFTLWDGFKHMLRVDDGTGIIDQAIILELNEWLHIVINTPHTPNCKAF